MNADYDLVRVDKDEEKW